MQNGIHFISGLPRSGSTLLAALLRQNPRFHAAMTSPVATIYTAVEGALSRRNEAAVFIDDTQRRDVLRGVFENYYRILQKDKLIFDTNRIWCTKLAALSQLFPNSRVVCCVRDLPWIMDSFERLIRNNAFELSGMFGYEAGGNVYTRVNRLAASDGLVGYALDSLKDAFFGEQAAHLVLVEYEALVRAPHATLRHLYRILEEPPFEHDTENVEYEADQFDLALGTPGLHRVRRKVEWIERQSLLPPELFQRFANDMFWRHQNVNIRQVPIVRLET
jgi:sulfotransferase